MAFDNSFVVMNEEEMHDVNGGWFGWSSSKFKHNVGVIAKYICYGVVTIMGTIGLAMVNKAVSLFVDNNSAQVSVATVLKNVASASIKTLKGMYAFLVGNWGWVLGAGIVALALGTAALGYVRLA